jgi:hypothetical protein
MAKHKTINVYGVDIKIKTKFETPRRKTTTNVDEELFSFIKDIGKMTNREISSCFDCMILTIRDNPDCLKKFIKTLEDY